MRSTDPTQPIEAVDPLVGTRLGEYEVLEPIGEGGMGVVYRGVQPIIKKRVAIKVLKPNVSRDLNHVRRLTDEAEAVNSIRHRNIIDIFSLGQLPDGRPYIVMEFLEGRPLDSYVLSVGRLALPEALSLLIAVCGPLAAAHRANVIHRDLKPSNIFVCVGDDGERYLKLLDFGLAKKAMSLSGTTEQTSRAQVIGTPNYMAPEQAKGLQVSARTDIYALGVMAYEFVTGSLPYRANSPFEMISQHVSAPVPSAKAVQPDLPEALDALLTRMMAKQPEARVQTVDEVRAALKELAQTVGPGPRFSGGDTVTGDYDAFALRPRATPMAARAAVESTADTVLSQSTGKVLRTRAWGLGAAAAGAIVAFGALAWRLSPAPRPPPMAMTGPALVEPLPPLPPAPLVAPVPPLGTEPPRAELPPPPGPSPVARVEPAPETRVAPHLAPRRPEAPSVDALRARVAKLEAQLARSVPAGEDPDPSAVTLLRKYKVEATMAESAEERARLAHSLDAFERTFLKR